MAKKSGGIRPTLLALKVGEKAEFDILKLKSVRTEASELGAIHEIGFRTWMDRDARTITVERIS